MFKRSKKKIEYDKTREKPAIKTSICTDEKVAGFLEIVTGKFRDYMLISDSNDLQKFCDGCGVSEEELKHIV